MDQALNSGGTSSPDHEVALAELAALRAGELSAEEEARLRMRMARDPEVENKLWALDNVHRLFAKSTEQAELPAEMPYDVAARLQARIAEQALKRGDHACPESLLGAQDDSDGEHHGDDGIFEQPPGQ